MSNWQCSKHGLVGCCGCALEAAAERDILAERVERVELELSTVRAASANLYLVHSESGCKPPLTTPGAIDHVARLDAAWDAMREALSFGRQGVSLRVGFMRAVFAELDRAIAKHGDDRWSRHEFYAVLKEEVDELWDGIKANAPLPHILAETAQVAAVCVRYVETST